MKRILLVDDSKVSQMLVQQAIMAIINQELEFVYAMNGREALAVLKNQKVDLMITDLVMPIMDGFELLDRVAASPRLCCLPVIVVSCKDTPAVEEKLEGHGAVKVLKKPLQGELLAKTLESVFQGEDDILTTKKGDLW